MYDENKSTTFLMLLLF